MATFGNIIRASSAQKEIGGATHKASFLCAAVFLLTISDPSIAGIRTEANTTSVDFGANTYNISDKSLWGPNGPGRLNIDWSLSQSQWDSVFGEPPAARLGVGNIEKVCVFKCARFGASAGLEFSAYALPYLNAEVQPGTFDATVSFAPSVNNYQFEGLGVDFFKLDTNSGIGNDSVFSVNAPSIKLDTGIDVNTSLDLFAKACFVGCFIDKTFNLIEEDFQLPLLQVDTLESSARVFVPPTNLVDAAPAIRGFIGNPPSNINDALTNDNLYKDVGALLGAQVGEGLDDYEERLRNSGNTVRADSVSKARSAIEDSPVTVSLSNPFSSNAEGLWSDDQATATASIGGNLLDLRLDVDQVIGAAFNLPNGGSLSLDDVKLGNPFIDLSVTLVDLQVGPSIDLKTDLQLKPELMVDLQFTRGQGADRAPASVIIQGEIGKQTSFRGSWEDIPEIALIASPTTSASGAFSLSDDPVFATPTFFVESTLSNRTYLDISAGLELYGPSGSIDIKDVGGYRLDSGFSLEKSQGIAQVDIFNRTFTNPGADWTSDGTTTGQDLSFVAAGEILFQARSVVNPDVDVAFSNDVKDNRIDQQLTVDTLIANEIDRRGYDYTPLTDNLNTFDILLAVDILASQFGDISRPGPLFLFEDGDVKAAVRDSFTIDASQTAQVMTDGSLTVANPADRLVVEADGALELAAKHPYGTVGGDGSGSATTQYGLTNLGTVDIHGDVYMGTGGVAVEDYVYRNGVGSGDSSTTIGPTGRVKLDGRLENSEGSVIDNYGRLELTGISSESKGQIVNRYLAEADIYGGLELEANALLVRLGPDRTLLDNTGTFTLHGGAQVNARSTKTALQTAGKINNNGQLIVKEDSALTLASEANGASLTLNNHFLLDNAGTLRNLGGTNAADSRIVNGKPGHDWSMFRNVTDIVATLLDDRAARVGDGAGLVRREPILPVLPGGSSASSPQSQIAGGGPSSPVAAVPVIPVPTDLTANYAGANVAARLAANIAASAKQVFLSEMNRYINDSSAILDALINEFPNPITRTPIGLSPTGKPLFRTDVDESFTRAILGRLETEYLVLRTDTFATSPAFDLRAAEENYGAALRSLGTKRDQAAAIYAQIDTRLQQQADTGVGVIVNRGTGVLENGGLVTNHSVLLNETGGQVYNTQSGELNNSGGYVRNNGLLVNAGTLVNTVAAAIDNGLKSVRDAMGVLGLAELVNLGDFDNEGEVINNDTFVNYGTLNNRGASQDTRIVNNGVMTNVGTLTNAAALTNAQGAELTNHNTLVNDGEMVNNGVFNNGQEGMGPPITLSRFVEGANNFYDGRRRLIGFNNDIRRYDEQIRDSEAREALVELNTIPLLEDGSAASSVINSALVVLNNLILAEYDRKTAAVRAETDALKNQRVFATANRDAAEQSIRNIDAVAREMRQNENGEMVAGDLFLNLARLGTTNTAELVNNGTFTNRGIFNNVATVTNSAGGLLENNGLFMVSEEGVIDNAGTLLIAESSANGFSQSGMLTSDGAINNSGTIKISSGVLLNGTVNDAATLNNTGTIGLTANAGDGTSAILINEGVLINGPFGSSISIGTAPVLAAQEGRGSANTFFNAGTVKNSFLAGIINYGELINTGVIDNFEGSTFKSDGTLHNMKSGEIHFADAAQLNGFTVNDGLITMADNELLTLTGDISGSGTFAGNVLIEGDEQRDENGKLTGFTTSVNPGNSPGLLTFNGDVGSQNVDWIMEIWGTERGFSYDGININGNFTLGKGFGLTLLSWLDVDSMLGQTFTFFSVTGDLLDAAGDMIARSSFDFVDFSSDLMRDSWAGTWVYNAAAGWDLNLSFIDAGIDLYAGLAAIDIQTRLGNSPSAVPVPATLWLFLVGVGSLMSRRRTGDKGAGLSVVDRVKSR